MAQDLLARAWEQAERSAAAVGAAAILRIARVETAFDRKRALCSFQIGLDAVRGLSGYDREYLLELAKLIAAAVDPGRVAELPDEARGVSPLPGGTAVGLPELAGTRREYRPRAVKQEIDPGGGVDVEDTAGRGPGGPRIRCPKCNWSPRAGDRWFCNCGHTWNTFDTGGVCPGCLYQWKITACHRCGEFSPHSDWYAQE